MPDSNSSPPAPSTSEILLVEDDVSLAQSVIDALSEGSLRVTHAAHGAEIFDILSRSRFDLILLDLQLPGVDGLEILERLRTLPSAERAPVIVTSADHEIPVKVRCFDLGAADFLPKPYDSLELWVRVHTQIQAKRRRDALLAKNRELAAARRAAEESSKAKAGFLANMSHEIRTPMNGVIAMTGLLLQTELDEEQRDFVETIRTSGESLLSIINDVLHFSKIESGKMELEQEPVNLRSCIESTLDILSSKAAEKNLELIYRLDPRAPSNVLGDEARLRQILVNLVGNAIKFTDQGAVCVEVKAGEFIDDALRRAMPAGREVEAEWQLQFSVTDTGMGIPREKLPLLFQSFTQADSTITRRFGGTGLGLAISKGLVELMGGRIWAESEEGRGSSFQFLVPFRSAGAADTSFTKSTVQSLRDLQALVLMENEMSANVLAEQLRRWGMKTHCATDPRKVLHRLRAGNAFDVVLLDEEIHGTKGTELAKTIRTMPTGQNLPLILLSHLGKRGDASELLGPENTLCLNKPVKPEPLQEGLLKVMARLHQPLPTRIPSPASPAPAPPPVSAPPPLRILVADDNLINLKVASRLLRQLGYDPDVVQTGLEAVEAIEKNPYDIVLMDVQMPEMNGLEATRSIRRRQQEPSAHPHFHRRITVVAMTANAMPGDREKCLAAGMDDYVTKPVRPELLEKTLRRLSVHNQAAQNEPATDASSREKIAKPDDATAAFAPIPLPAAEHDDHPVDVDRLTEFVGSAPDGMEELLGLYTQQTEGQLRGIRQALATGEGAQAAAIAHSCAGASATCGMVRLVPLLRRMEQLGLDGDLAAAAALMENIQTEYHRTKKFLEDRFNFGASDAPQTIAL